MAITWTVEELESLHHQRNPGFLSIVLKKMEESSVVLFGNTGRGLQPRYQVEGENGEKETFRGDNHEPFVIKGARVGEFEKRNLSDPFTYKQIRRIVGRR